MRALFLLGAFLCLCPLHAQGLLQRYAHLLTPPPHYTCLHTQGSIAIDGLLDEPDWQRAPHTKAFVDIQGEGHPAPLHHTTAQLLWDEHHLYIAATLVEPNITARLHQRDTIVWKDNDFEVFLDPAGKGTHYYEFEINALGTLMDLLMTRPYRSGGDFLMPWDCKGLRHAVRLQGTLNLSADQDQAWTLEMAIPIRTLRHNFDYLRGGTAGEVWRLNFSRVQWLKPQGPEENWVWAPTGKVDIHMPERWGYLHFALPSTPLPQPISHQAGRRLLWAIFYAQEAHKAQHQSYCTDLADLGLSPTDLNSLPPGHQLSCTITASQFLLSIARPDGGKITLDHQGECLDIPPTNS